jgi:hypothetical protein
MLVSTVASGAQVVEREGAKLTSLSGLLEVTELPHAGEAEDGGLDHVGWLEEVRFWACGREERKGVGSESLYGEKKKRRRMGCRLGRRERMVDRERRMGRF